MLILALETSAKAVSVALHDGQTLLAESYQNTGLTHSQTLMRMAQQLLQCSQKTVVDVTHVAVAAGPGSFTGVRIGVAAAKGLGWGGQLPVYGVSTLEAMARGLGLRDGVVCACMDARRAQVYNALFRVRDGVPERLSQDRAISLEELSQELETLDEPVYLVGDGSTLTWRTLKDAVPNLMMPPEHQTHQRASGVALAALEAIARGDSGDGNALTPNYLRLSQAERERLEKKKENE